MTAHAAPGRDARIASAIDQLTRVKLHVVAGSIEPSAADAMEYVELVLAVSTLDAETVEGWLGRVGAYVKRVCPQACTEAS